MRKKIHRYARHTGRWLVYAGAALLLLLTIAAITAHRLLPQLAERKGEIEAAINRVSPHPVRLGRLSTYWDSLYPGIAVDGIEVLSADGRASVLRLPAVRLSLSWLPLLWREFRIHNLEITGPKLVLERLTDGRFRLAGFTPVTAGTESQGEEFLQWLFRQRRLAVHEGELVWRDRRDPGPAIQLSRVELSLRNDGERHRLDLSAVFPPALCHDCTLAIDVTGNPFVSPDWQGKITLRANALDLAALPRIARERLPERLTGQFNVDLRTHWQHGLPQRVDGSASVTGLTLPLKNLVTPLRAREMKGTVSWKATDSGWQLELDKLILGFVRPTWQAGQVRLTHSRNESTFEAEHLDLDDLTAFAETVQDQHDLLRQWVVLRPVGRLAKLDLQLAGDWQAPSNFSFQARLEDVAVQPFRRAPGLQGVSGRVRADNRGGEFLADSGRLVMRLPEVFRGALEAEQVRGRVNWDKHTDAWEISGEDLRLTASGGQASGGFTLRLPFDAVHSPHLRFEGDFSNLDGAQAARYYPVRHLSAKTLAWMERAFVGGRVTKGRVLYDGPTRAFPFSGGEGRFEVRAHVRDGIYDYLPGWVPVREADVDVAVDRDQFRITGRGRIGQIAARNVTVQTERMASGQDQVRVRGEASGTLDDALHVLRQVKPQAEAAAWIHYLPTGLQGRGNGTLHLDISVPFSEVPARVAGEYRFEHAGLHEPESGATVEALEGKLGFSDQGLRETTLKGRVLGGEATLEAVLVEQRLQLQAQGRIAQTGLSAVLGPRLASYMSGDVGWTARWQTPPKGPGAFRLELGLQGLKSRLPPPLYYPNGLPLTRLVWRSDSATADRHTLVLETDAPVSGHLLFRRERGAWQLAGGRVSAGDVPGRNVPTHFRGVQASARIDTLDLDRWFPLLRQEGVRVAPAWLTRVTADVGALDFFNRPLGHLSFDLTRETDAWAGTVAGTSASGRVRYAGSGPESRIELDLAALSLPAARTGAETVADEIDPRRLPALTLRSKAFVLRDRPLGALDMAARPFAAGWRIEHLTLEQAETQLAVQGDWSMNQSGQRSEFDIRLTSDDIGGTFNALGFPDQMSGGQATVVAHLSWPAAPTGVRATLVSGNVDITSEKGRFLHVKQGASRFFGILDLSAIGRYLTLDFSPIFGQGFAYDSIHGKMTLERGNLYTDNLSLRGPSAKIGVRGRIGLAAEDFDLALEVQPQLTDSLTIGSLTVFGPQVAAAVLALQKLFKKEITESTRVNYSVKGPWHDPTVTRTIQEGRLEPGTGG